MSSPPKSAGSFPTGPYPTGGMDDWRDAGISKPEKDQFVSAWTGRFLVKCRYDKDRQIWVTAKGTPIKCLMWHKYIGNE